MNEFTAMAYKVLEETEPKKNPNCTGRCEALEQQLKELDAMIQDLSTCRINDGGMIVPTKEYARLVEKARVK